MAKISREAACIAAANLVQAVMAAKSGKSGVTNPAVQAESLYRRFFAMVRETGIAMADINALDCGGGRGRLRWRH